MPTVLVCVVLLSVLAPGARALASSPEPGPLEVGAAVGDVVDATGQARVLVTLRDPVSLETAGAERQAAVTAAQDAVLARLPAADVTLLHRYRNVAGLAVT